ncbi:MAG: polyprenyl synthetase family protein [Acidimicrobiales bacterium]
MEPRSSIDQVTDAVAQVVAESTGLLGRALEATRSEDPPAGERRDRLNALIDLVLLGGHLLADSGGAVVEAAVDRIADDEDEPVLRATVGQWARLQRRIEIQNVGRSQGPVDFHATELIGPEETARIAAPSVESSGDLDPLEKAEVMLTLDVGDAPPGVYAGMLRAYNSDAWLLLEITVNRVTELEPAQLSGVVDELTARVRMMLGDRFAAIHQAKAMGDEKVDTVLKSVLEPHGRLLRSTLCAAACEAMGGAPDDAREAMVGIELVHTAMLIRDDIEDGATLRRKNPTLHTEIGIPKALAIADLLLALGTEEIAKAAERYPGVGPQLMSAYVHMLGRTAEGQARELLLRKAGAFEPGIEHAIRIMHDKTAWYTTLAPIQIGALIGAEAAPTPCRVLSWPDLMSYGTHLGLAFQLTDDLSNLGEPDGKNARGSDITEGKPTLILELLRGKLTDEEKQAFDSEIEAAALSVKGKEQAAADPDAVQAVINRLNDHNIVGEAADHVVEWCRQARADLALAFDEPLGEQSKPADGELPQWRIADFLSLLPQYLEFLVADRRAGNGGAPELSP